MWENLPTGLRPFLNAVSIGIAGILVDCSGVQSLATITGDTTSSIVLTPSAALPASTACTVTVVAAQVSDTDGIAPANMAADYIFTFTTGP